mgnify:FL=1
MEPIASSGAGAVFRPSGGGSTEIAALLRNGRVLSAEVLSPPGDGTVLLAIGRHSIPAESNLRLDPGARFLVRVEQGAEGVVLKMLAAGGGQDEALLSALRGVVGERPLGEVLGELGRALRAALGRSDLPPELRTLGQALAALAVVPEGASALRTLLGTLGLGHEAALASLLGGRAGQEELARLRGDLKSLLLRAHTALHGGAGAQRELNEAVARALTTLEAEQLLNLAREKSGEPLVLSLPFPDGDGWTTARLAVPSRSERESAEAGGDEVPFRLSLALELTNLGPLRADLTLVRGFLSLRLLVTSPAVAARIESGFSGLRERLSGARRALDLQVRLVSPAETALGFEPLDIRFLREHHLMNIAG